MRSVRSGMVVLLCLVAPVFVAGADYTLEKTENLPDGLTADVSQALNPEGHRVSGSGGPLCTLWLAKAIPAKEGFSPTLSIKYPLSPGQFIGVLQVQGAKFSDFRDQRLLPGLYTLRYGQQPQDGNHVGTSDYSDFLLALRTKDDKSPERIDNVEDAQSLSADAAGTAHPAIFQLLPPEEGAESKATLVHDDSHDHWIIQAAAAGEKPLPLRLIIVGVAAE